MCSDLGGNLIASKQSYRQPQETDDGSLNDKRVFCCIDEQTVQVVLYAPPEYCHPIPAHTHTHTTILRHFFRDHPAEPVPEEDFWTLWRKGRLTEADIDHLAGCYSIRTNWCPPPSSPPFFTGWMPFLPPNQQCQSTEGLAHSD